MDNLMDFRSPWGGEAEQGHAVNPPPGAFSGAPRPPPARLKLKRSQTELGGELQMLPLRGSDEHTFSRAHGKRQSSIGGVDLVFLFFEFADTPPFPRMSHPVSPTCQR